MLAQICQFLAVDSSNFPENEHIIVGDKSHEGCFLIHYFLNLCQKQNRPVCFVGLSQSFSHYNTVAQKLGTNLLSARDQNKNLIFIEGLKLINDCVGFSEYSDQTLDVNPFLELLNGDSASFLRLIRSSVDRLVSYAGKANNGPVVIVDDLSVLLSAGVTSKDLKLIVKSIQDYLFLGSTKGSLVTYSTLEEEDEETEEIWAFMSHICTLTIEISALKSGYCKDVHGQMQIQWHDSMLKPRNAVVKKTQFKLSDKTVNLFAAGMSAAVL